MKLFLKKLLTTILFFSGLLLIASVLSLLRYVLQLQEATVYSTSVIVSTSIMLYLAYKIRSMNKTAKTVYLAKKKSKKHSVETEFYSTLRSKENTIHTIAFLTILCGISVVITVSTQLQAASAIIGTIVILLIGGVLFAPISALLWCLAQKSWRKVDKRHKKARQ